MSLSFKGCPWMLYMSHTTPTSYTMLEELPGVGAPSQSNLFTRATTFLVRRSMTSF